MVIMSTTRQFKFRVWDIRHKQWRNPYPNLPLVWLAGDGSFASSWPSDDLIIEQWTGLTDLTGKEVFEGDIVRVQPEDVVGYVKYRAELAGYTLGHPDGEAFRWDLYLIDREIGEGVFWNHSELARTREPDTSRMTVIGNIHEHQYLTPPMGSFRSS